MPVSDLFKEPRGLFVDILTVNPEVVPEIHPGFNLARRLYAFSALIFCSVVQCDKGVMDCDYFLRGDVVYQPPAAGAPPPDGNLNYIPLLVHVVYERPCHLDIFAAGAGALWGRAHNSVPFESMKNVMYNVLFLSWFLRRELGEVFYDIIPVEIRQELSPGNGNDAGKSPGPGC